MAFSKEMGDQEKAVEALDSLISIDPNNPHYYYLKSVFLYGFEK